VFDDPFMGTFLTEALDSQYHVVKTRRVSDARNLLMVSNAYFDAMIVTCLISPKRPHQFPGVPLVATVFQHRPWLPVIVIGHARERARLISQLLPSGVRAVLARTIRADMLRKVVARVMRKPGRGAPAGAVAIASIRRTLAYLAGQIGEPLILEDLAKMAAMSRSHFSHTFHAVAGMPLRDYVRDLRLKEANHLLLGSGLSITVVAIEAGFYDLPHFDKIFRQRFDMSPNDFRRHYGLRRNGGT
jgi:AraC-like DNA-binding protein